MTVYQWLTLLGVPGILTALGGLLCLQVRENRAMKDGIRAILRDRLLQCFQTCSRQGFATPDERQNFENMYVQYHALGGNGVMDDIRQKFFSLPLK